MVNVSGGDRFCPDWGANSTEQYLEQNEVDDAGGRETFTATRTYDTLDLYGELQASWEIVVVSGD
jgi:hypothetical protein